RHVDRTVRARPSFGLECGPRAVKGDVMARLAEHPDLAQLRRRAKELYRAARSHDQEAVAQIRAVSDGLSLNAAQLALARAYGFASWPRLKSEVERRRCIDAGDGPGLARVVAADPRWRWTPSARASPRRARRRSRTWRWGGSAAGSTTAEPGIWPASCSRPG